MTTADKPADASERPAGAAADQADDGSTAADTDAATTSPGEPTSNHNWRGLASYVTGALGLGPAAVPLGHLGLRAHKRGSANNRPFSLAGVILGYVSVAVIVAVSATWYFAFRDDYIADMNDINAQLDVAALGRHIALEWVETGETPLVSQNDSHYVIGDTQIDAALTVQRELTFTGSQATSWCLMIEHEGGHEEAYSYTPSRGLLSGAQCEVPVDPEVDQSG